jgi:glyoxylase-like metal-dependent hydrolase (beta-lactamase superfamily II)
MRMPLGGALAFINVWALKEEGGWAIVDTGYQTPATAAAWRQIFAEVLGGEPVTRVIVTHMHPDHIGMAGWITRKFGCRLWITRLEYLMCRVLSADTGREAPEDGLRFYRAAGWDPDAIDHYRSRFGGFGKALHALPDSFRRLSDGEEIAIGDHVWRVVVGNGHSPEHACLYCPALKLLISGDQVLPRISSNVSVFPTEPDGDPLRDWLSSLARIKTRVPDDVLVLPAHNDPFHGLHSRLDHLIGGHERALIRLEQRLAEPRRAIDVFGVLFKRAITPDLLGMATGEALAHLNCLIHREVAVRETDAAGVDWYRTDKAT